VIGSVTRPVRELRGFRRLTLRPGERRTERFPLAVDDLAFHDAALRRVAEPGAFRVFAGGSSVAALEARFTLVTGDGAPVAVPLRCRATR
jgi:beta-glucosidase